jgi:hypothetical protein
MKGLRKGKGCTRLHHSQNEDIRKETKIQPVKSEKDVHRHHLDRMTAERMPKYILQIALN